MKWDNVNNDRTFIFWWTIPLKSAKLEKNYIKDDTQVNEGR